MSAVKKMKQYARVAGIFTVLVAAIFVAYNSLKPDLDAGVSFFQNDNCEPFLGDCLATRGNQTIEVNIGGERIESMTDLPIRVRLEHTAADSVLVDFVGINMYMGRVRTLLTPQGDGIYQGTIRLPECGTGGMLWRARVLLEKDAAKQGVRFDFRAT